MVATTVVGPHLPIPPDILAEVCERHHVRRLSLFGSTARGTAGPGSDIDLLVEFREDATPTLFDMEALQHELSVLLGGRRIDLRTAGELSRYFRDDVVRDAVVQYVAA